MSSLSSPVAPHGAVCHSRVRSPRGTDYGDRGLSGVIPAERSVPDASKPIKERPKSKSDDCTRVRSAGTKTKKVQAARIKPKATQ